MVVVLCHRRFGTRYTYQINDRICSAAQNKAEGRFSRKSVLVRITLRVTDVIRLYGLRDYCIEAASAICLNPVVDAKTCANGTVVDVVVAILQ